MLRVARLEFRDHPRVTDAAELRLPAGVVVDGEIRDERRVADLLRRLWDQLKFAWEPVHAVTASRDARFVELPAGDEFALEQLKADLGVDRYDDHDQLVTQMVRATGGTREIIVTARRSVVEHLEHALDRAGLSVAAIDTVPTALARTQPALWFARTDVALRYVEGGVVWSQRIGNNVSTAVSASADSSEHGFDTIVLTGAQSSLTPVLQLADVEISERVRSRVSIAQLAVPTGAALASAPKAGLIVDLREALPLETRAASVLEPGVAWAVEELAAGTPPPGKRRR